ncbi:MAG: hypothetical protein M0R06_01490 [Sphaerochaeta sp.]|jgi:hypothetical protein|nr:hypothetical protein [Sphaerochaeta sp.]
MSKYIPDAVLDAGLDYIAGSDEYHICAGQPADYADVTNHSLGHVGIDSGDFTKDDGDVSGRKLIVGLQTVTPDGDGDVDHIVLVKTTDTTIRGITTISTKTVATGVDQEIQPFDILELRDPS